MHCDTATEMYLKNQDFYKNGLAVSGEKGEVFNNWVQTFAVFVSETRENPYEFYKNVLSNAKRKICKKVNPIFSLEGGTPIDSIERILELKNDGIRFIALTWNGENSMAGGVNSQKGLTDFGKSVIEKMNALKIALDVSHLNEKSFYASAERAEFVLATHSNLKSICDVSRNLSDNQAKLIAEKDGIIGLNFYPKFLCGDFTQKIYENICRLCDMGYENNIAIGSDFDGATIPKEISDISKIPALFEVLREKGLKKELLNKIFFKNALNFVRRFDKIGLV